MPEVDFAAKHATNLLRHHFHLYTTDIIETDVVSRPTKALGFTISLLTTNIIISILNYKMLGKLTSYLCIASFRGFPNMLSIMLSFTWLCAYQSAHRLTS